MAVQDAIARVNNTNFSADLSCGERLSNLNFNRQPAYHPTTAPPRNEHRSTPRQIDICAEFVDVLESFWALT